MAGHPIVCTGSPDSIIAVLRAHGFERPMLKVGMRTHNVELILEPYEDGALAARILYETLPAGTQTVGTESHEVPGLWGPAQVRLSRSRPMENEPYDRRGRVPQTPAEGYEPVEPHADLVWIFRSNGVLAWDLHQFKDKTTLYVNEDAHVSGLTGDLVLHLDGYDKDSTKDILEAHGTITVQTFRFRQPRPGPEDTWISVQNVAELLDEPVASVMSKTLDYVVEDHFLRGPGYMNVDFESFNSWLTDKGFISHWYQGRPIGSPMAHYEDKMRRAEERDRKFSEGKFFVGPKITPLQGTPFLNFP